MDRIICDLCYFNSPQSFIQLLENNCPTGIQKMALMELYLCSLCKMYSHTDYIQICQTFLDFSQPLIQIFALLDSKLCVYLFLEAIRRDKLKYQDAHWTKRATEHLSMQRATEQLSMQRATEQLSMQRATEQLSMQRATDVSFDHRSNVSFENNETLHDICRLVQIMKSFTVSIDCKLTIRGYVFPCGRYEPDYFAAVLLGLYQVPVVVMYELIKTCEDRSFLIGAINVMKTKSIAPHLISEYQQLLNEVQIIRPICIRPASAPARLETSLTDADNSIPTSLSPASKLIHEELQKCFDELDAEEGEKPPKKIHRDETFDVPSPGVPICPTITSMLHTAIPSIF